MEKFRSGLWGLDAAYLCRKGLFRLPLFAPFYIFVGKLVNNRHMRYFTCCIFLILFSFAWVSCDKSADQEPTVKIEVPDKALFIGNSLLLGNGTFGMNATDLEHDYYYIIQQHFLQVNPAYTGVKLAGVGLEACETRSQQLSWIEETLRPVLSDDLDLVVIQIGDNVNTPSKKSVFEQGAKELIATIKEVAPQARIVWMYGWYVSNEVIQAIKNACNQYDVSFIAINDIHTTENCSSIGMVVTRTTPTTQSLSYTSYTQLPDNRLQIDFKLGGKAYTSIVQVTGYSDDVETKTLTWQGYETITTDTGIASHPGNSGFEKIAQRFLAWFNIE